MTLKPGVKGPKPSLYWSSVEKPTMVVVRPWKLSAQTMISALSFVMPLTFSPHLRAALMAVSTASAPEFMGSTFVVAGQLADFLAEQGQLVVAEGAAGQGDLGGLAAQGLQQPGMAVALVHGAVGGQEIHEAVAFDVFDPDAFGLLDDDVQGVVVVGPVLVLDLDELLGLHGNLLHGLFMVDWCCGRVDPLPMSGSR